MAKYLLSYDEEDVKSGRLDVDSEGVLKSAGGGAKSWDDLGAVRGVLFDGSFEPDFIEDGYAEGSFISSGALIDGEEYVVMFDGVEYTLVSKSVKQGLIVLGNSSLIGMGEDTGEPFVLIHTIGYEQMFVIVLSENDKHDVLITGPMLVTIPHKYIPTDMFVGLPGTGENSAMFNAAIEASGESSHAEGMGTVASGDYSHAEGSLTNAIGTNSHAENSDTYAVGYGSHAEGSQTIVSSMYGHVGGRASSVLVGDVYKITSTSRNVFTLENASGLSVGDQVGVIYNGGGSCSCITKIESISGNKVTVSDDEIGKGDVGVTNKDYLVKLSSSSSTGAFAHGHCAVATGLTSAAFGAYAFATGDNQFVIGRSNIVDLDKKYLFIVGNGGVNSAPINKSFSNAHTLDWEGNAWFAGTVEGTGIIIKSSTTGSTKRFKITVDDSGTLSATEVTE